MEKHLNETKKIHKNHKYVEISDNRRPVFGVLSEPFAGEVVGKDREELSYIPKAHVRFLEQAGVRVVPISFRSSADELASLLNQVNGVYMPGDSPASVTDYQYMRTA